MTSPVRIYISVPSARDWKPRFGASLVGMLHHLQKHGVCGQPADLGLSLMAGASLLSRARQNGLMEAIKGNYDYYLMLDDDMGFPPDLVDRFYQRQLDVVASNCCLKIKGKTDGTAMGFDGQYVGSLGKTGVEEVAWVGFAVAMLKISAIKHIEAPHFEVHWLPDRKEYLGEDLYFCEKLRQGGVKIHVDHDVSHEVSHMGDYAYGFGG